jgi:hypothetical protein
LQKAVQNPVASLISVPLQNNTNFSLGSFNRTQDVLNIQPVIPANLSKNWMLITRVIQPVIWLTYPTATTGGEYGLGDMVPTFFFSPRKPGKLIWGAGPALTIPTATNTILGQGKLSLGPSGVAQGLPTPYQHWTGDLNGMIKRQQIRALVVYSRTAFFYDQGRPEDISYEALQEFQRTLNREFRTGNLPVTVTFLPLGYDQLEEALTSGLGDLIAIPVAITPERQQKVAFSTPVMTGVKQFVVTGPSSAGVTNLNHLSGKENLCQSIGGLLREFAEPQQVT